MLANQANASSMSRLIILRPADFLMVSNDLFKYKNLVKGVLHVFVLKLTDK